MSAPSDRDDDPVDLGALEALEETEPNEPVPPPLATSLARSSALMAAGTVLSRISGVLRDIAAAAALGFFIVADAFSLGNSLPTIVYILVVGGALNAVFIPQLVRHMKDDADEGKAYADRLLTLAGVVLLALSVIAVVAAPLIVDLYTPDDYPAREFELAVAFARLCLPQIFFYGLYSLLSQVLNARGKFGAPMFAPIANNIVAIATFLLFIAIAGTSAAADGALTADQVLILGIGTTLGVLVQALVLLPVLLRSGYAWRPRWDWRGAGLGKAGSLAVWTIGLVLVNQAAYVVIARLAAQANVDASTAGTVAAGFTTYQKAHLVFMLPHSVITVSVVTALLPALSRVAHSGNLRGVAHDLGKTMRMVGAVILPVAAVLLVIGSGLAVLLFGYGAATDQQASAMGQVVSVFMIGLLPFTLFYVLLRGFYALEDTRTPFIITVVFNLVFLAIAVPVSARIGGGVGQVAFLAFAYSLSYWVAFVIAWIVLGRRLGGLDSRRTAGSLLRMAVATGVSIFAMLAVQVLLVQFVTGGGFGNRGGVLLNVVAVSAVGLLVYFLFAFLLRIREVSEAARLLVGGRSRGR